MAWPGLSSVVLRKQVLSPYAGFCSAWISGGGLGSNPGARERKDDGAASDSGCVLCSSVVPHPAILLEGGRGLNGLCTGQYASIPIPLSVPGADPGAFVFEAGQE